MTTEDPWVDGPTRTVTCTTPDCINAGHPISVPDDGSMVVCGPCGATLSAAAA